METVPDPIEEHLNQFEHDIRQLKIEYEQYFGGGRPRPPADTQWRVDNLVRRHNERIGDLSFGQRFLRIAARHLHENTKALFESDFRDKSACVLLIP